MEISLKPLTYTPPAIKTLIPGDVFIRREEGLHSPEPQFYMVCQHRSLDEAYAARVPAVCLKTGRLHEFRDGLPVIPAKAQLSLEATIG